MRHVLVVHYSQTGQLNKIVERVTGPLCDQDQIQVDFLPLQMQDEFPFPWPFWQFFDIFPETVLQKPQPLKPFVCDTTKKYDLVILAYQVWFLSPSLPMTSFLATPQAEQLLKGTPVMTLIGCRNMWLMAQEKMKQRLNQLGAVLVDNVALTDACGSAASFLATPMWMFTGKRQAYSWLPKAGVCEQDIENAKRFGVAIKERMLANAEPIREPMLCGLGAVSINEKLIASERIGNRSFQVWSRLLYRLGPPKSFARGLGLRIYLVFLLLMIVTVVPVTALLKKLLSPLMRKKVAQQKAELALPSGELKYKESL